MYLTLALVMLGVMSVSAADRIPVDAEHFTFHTYNGWDANATETGVATGENGNFLLDQADGCPIGDTNCNAWIDLGAYSKMYVKMAGCDAAGELNGSNPRIFINRTADNGQFNADKNAAQCLVIPNAGWAEDYYTVEADGTYVIDLTKIGKEWGFVHFHSIKGSAWDTKAIVYSIEVEKAATSQQIGWVNLINNSDMEGDDNSSFWTKLWTDEKGNDSPIFNSIITDGVGMDGSRGIKIEVAKKEANAWDNQFWFRFNELVPAGTKYRVSFDYKAETDAAVSIQAHNEPSQYLSGLFDNLTFSENWETFATEGESTNDNFLSVAFNLNEYAEANTYYFDNIKFEVYKYGTTVEFSNDVILVDFGFDTNLADLVKASGKTRLMYPNDCVAVKVNGEAQEIYSVEGFADGRFYIFLETPTSSEGDEVLVSFTNPDREDLRLIYTSGSVGSAVANFAGVIAAYNSEVEENDGYPYDWLIPTLVKADPEDGSFNLPTGFNTFKLYFDKNVDCSALVATINGQAMTISPSTGVANEITLGCDALADGTYTIKVTKIYSDPDHRLDDTIFGEESITVSVGKVNADPNDVYEVILSEDFSGDANGWQTTADAGGWQPANSGGGSRIMRNQAQAGMGYAPNILYVCSRGIPNNMNGTALYGNDEEKLTLKAKTYHLKFSAALWDSNSATLKAQVFPAAAVDEDGNADESQLVAEESKAITVDYKSSTDAVTFDVVFTAPAEGDYVLKFITGNSNGEPGGYGDGIALGNVKIEYIPSTAGAEETRLLNEALENAKAVRDDNADERYAGEDYDELVAAITTYEAEKDDYTAPSAYREAADVLNAAAQAMKDHRILCAKYDEQIVKAIDVERLNKDNKFARTTAYAQVQDLVAKYHGLFEWIDATDWANAEEGTDTVWQRKYTYDVLKDNAALSVAVPELEDIVTKTDLLFTEGKSTPEGSNSGKGTGVAVFVERLRLGVEALKSLGVAEDDELIVAANNALTDDDELAEAIKTRIKLIVYGQLKEKDNDLFPPTTNEETGETTTPEYDMTVFVKNPNIYKQEPNMNFTEENVPGWIVPEGFNRPGLTIGWGAAKNVEGVAEDCMFQTWNSSYRVEQTIGDLPAGVYTIQMGFGERQDEASAEDCYIYVQSTSMDEPEQVQAPVIGQAFPFLNMSIEGVVVEDGILTIGVNAGNVSHTFFNDVRVWLTAPISEGFDYASAYEEVATGVETAETPAKVRAIQLYDLNGNRITTARKGIVIVKKLMNDGTVRTEKVIKK